MPPSSGEAAGIHYTKYATWQWITADFHNSYCMDLQKTDIAYNMLHGYGEQLIFILVCHLAMENSCVDYSTSAAWLWSTAFCIFTIVCRVAMENS